MRETRRTWGVAALSLMAAVAAQGAEKYPRAGLLEGLDRRREAFAQVAREIWGFAEVGYQEEKSSALLQSQLKAAGFDVRSGVAGIPTAFVASWGEGRPVVALLAEFDALPGLSQAAVPERKAVVEGSEKFLWKRFDVGLIDRAVNGLAAFWEALAERARYAETGFVRPYVLLILAGAVAVVGYLLWS